MAAAAQVFVVDDDESARTGLRRVLAANGYDVETFASARAFMERPPSGRPACLVVDQRMPGLTGLELQQHLRASGGRLAVIFVSGYDDVATSVQAMKNGAIDFLTKPVEADVLTAAVDRALEASAEASAAAAERELFERRIATLTPRERQVGSLVLRGLLNKQIAGELGTAEKTIKVHRARVMQKLAVGSVAEFARLAERTHLLTEPLAPCERPPAALSPATLVR